MYSFSTSDNFLTVEDILSQVTEEAIFKIVFEDILEDGEKYLAPYRDDTVAKCYFERGYNGVLHFVDFADPRCIRKDCFKLIQEVYGLSLFESILFISETLGLTDPTSTSPRIPVIREKKAKIKRDNSISISSRPFQDRDKGFWSSYGITRANLIEDKVKAVLSFSFYDTDGKRVVITPYDITYCYTDFLNNHKKIYRPTSEFKWLTNCTQNDIGGLNHLSNITTETLIITKSYKDFRVLRNENLDCIWFQNEGMFPSTEALLPIISKFKHFIIFFDNDSTGLTASAVVREKLIDLCGIKPESIRSVIVPKKYLKEGIKDASDLRKENEEEFLNITKNKLIN